MDTLKTAKRLQQQGLQQAVSEELVEILNEFITSDPASKQDLEKATANLQKEIRILDVKIERIRADLHKEIIEIKADLQKEIKNTSLNIIKWVAGFLVGQLALFFALIRLFGQ
ncbi:MAG: hypothetical protein OXH57_08800 [Ekhidna sp.]|nr:hypothetical protein [Ekhidna sp.]